MSGMRFSAPTGAFLTISVFMLPSFAEEQCLRDAWTGFNSKNFTAAIGAAEQCIDDFLPRALRLQADLTKAGEKVPPTGPVAAAADKKRIFARGLLNDVAAAYFVKGRAAETLYKQNKDLRYRSMAEEAYKGAMKLTYGRTFDPKGWFWSPAEAAEERLAVLK